MSNQHNISSEFWDGFLKQASEYLFFNPKDNLIKGVWVSTDMGPREASEDIPTATYNPGSVATAYTGFNR